jgi:hypothetical protein
MKLKHIRRLRRALHPSDDKEYFEATLIFTGNAGPVIDEVQAIMLWGFLSQAFNRLFYI